MTLQEFSRSGEAQGMRLVGSNIIGVCEGYPYSIFLKSAKSTDTASLRFALNQALPGKNRKALKSLAPKGTRIAYIQTQVLLTVTAAPEEIFHAVSSLITTAVGCFQSGKKTIPAPLKCFACNKPGCDSAALSGSGVGALYQPAHASCVMGKSEKTAFEAQKNEQSGNFLLGLIGAIIGGFVGTLPNTALIMLAEWHSGYLYLLIPLASYFFYKLFRGRMGNFARLAVILSSVVAFVLMQFFVEYLDFIQLGYSITFFEVVEWYISDVPLGNILENIWFGALFLLIGLAASFSQIGKTNRDFIQQANADVESLMSLHGAPTPASYTTDFSSPASSIPADDESRYSSYDPEKPPMEIDL